MDLGGGARQAQKVTMSVTVGRRQPDGTVEYEHLGVTDSYIAPVIRRAFNRVRAQIERLHRDECGMAELVVDGGNAITVNRIRGTGTEPKYVGWGTGAGFAARADTTLFSEVATDLTTPTGTRATGVTTVDTTVDTDDTWVCTATITATGAGTVTNAGCFDNATIGSGSLYCKGDHPARVLASSDFMIYIFAVQHTN